MGRCHITREPNAPTTAPIASGDHFVDTSTNQTYISVGTSSVDDWILVGTVDIPLEGTVAPAGSLDIDTTPLDDFCVIKYIVCLRNDAENKYASFEMLAGKKTGTTVEDTVYARIGSILDVDVDFTVSGTDALLTFTNNEAFSIDIKVKKNLV